jgi:ABC-type Fe3+-hydroxamate transport system substrate-binding protein
MLRQKSLLISAALTAFILVIVGALVGGMVQANPPATTSQTQEATTPSDPAGEPATTPVVATTAYAVTPAEATGLALEEVQDGLLTGGIPELVSYEGTPAYEVVLEQGNVYVDASSGAILYNGAQAAPTSATTPTTRSMQYDDDEHEEDEHERREHREYHD